MFAHVRVTVRAMPEKPHGPWHELRALRERNGLTPAALARQSGVSRSYLSQLESGERKPSPVITKKLADALKVDYTDIARTTEPVSA